MQEKEKEPKINTTDKSTDDKSVCGQGAYQTVKKITKKENKLSDIGSSIQNGSISQTSKGRTFQNGAGCSSWLPTSNASSSSSLNDVLGSEKTYSNERSKNLAKNSNLLCKKSENVLNCAKKRLEKNYDNDSSSGNEGDEVLSGDDCCIYTYKGDQFADLPNSFFPVHIAEHDRDGECRENHNGIYHEERNQPLEDERSNPGSSPEMDYLEMDFDPGPSLEHDSEDVDGLLEQTINDCPVPDLPSEQLVNPDENSMDSIERSGNCQEPEPGPSHECFYLCSSRSNNIAHYCNSNCSSYNVNVRTKNHKGSHQTGHCSFDENGDYCDFEEVEGKEFEDDDVNKCKNQSLGGKRLDRKSLLSDTAETSGDKVKNESDSKSPFDGIMLWTEQEAISNQVTMLSSEVSCGATAVINVMLVLKMRFSIDNVKEGICTRLRSDSASIPQYLVSRSFAGVAHENLVRGIHHASHGTLYAKFFQMYPRRNIILSRWLCHWMKLGAVPIATMNVQRDTSPESSVNDTRHHQMVFGVSSKGIFMTNPLECLQDEELWKRLTSPSVLNIRRQEIVSRWSPDTSLKPLMFQSDHRWKTMNVLGQVVNIIRESPDPSVQGKFLTQHISIPASSGITLVIPRDSPGYEELVSTPDLPLCQPE